MQQIFPVLEFTAYSKTSFEMFFKDPLKFLGTRYKHLMELRVLTKQLLKKTKQLPIVKNTLYFLLSKRLKAISLYIAYI